MRYRKRILAAMLTCAMVFQSASGITLAQSSDLESADEVYVTRQEAQSDFEDPGYAKYLGLYEEDFIEPEGRALYSLAAPSTKWGSLTFYHDTRFASGYEIVPGIDVSKWQGTSIDWKKVKKAGVQFVFIRLGYRGTSQAGSLNMDPCYKTNLKNARAAGLKIGVYFFSQAKNASEGKAEARYVLDNLGTNQLDMPIAIDYEYAGGRLTTGISKSNKTAACQAFCQEIEKAGFEPMVYANKSMLTSSTGIDGGKLAKDYKIWLAQYNSRPSYQGDYQFWQCSSEASVSGISGKIDLDYWYQPVEPEDTPEDTTDSPSAEPSEPEEEINIDCPGKFSQTGKTSTTVSVSWGKVSRADGYILYRSSNPDAGFNKVADLDSSVTKYTDKKLQEGRTYYYKIKSYCCDSSGERVYSCASVAYEGATVLSNPYSVQTKRNAYIYKKPGSTSKVCSYSIPSGQILRVQSKSQDRNGSSWFKISYTKNSKTYTGYVKSSDLRYAVKNVSGLKTTSANTSKIAMSWTKASDADGYEIARATAYNGSYKKIKTITSGSTVKYTDSKLTNGREYYYKIRAYNVINGKKYYSSWTAYKGMQTKKSYSYSVQLKKDAYLYKLPGSSSKAYKYKIPKNKTFSVSYKGYDKSGNAWFCVTYKKGSKQYTGYIKSSYLRYYVSGVSSLKKTSGSTSKIAMSWKKGYGTKGYQIARATSYNGSYKLIKTITSASTVKFTDSKLSSNREYYYKIRAYNVINGKKYYSAWSSYKPMQTKTSKSLKVKTTANVVLRKGGGTSAKKILTVPKRKKLTVSCTTKDKKGQTWYKVSYKSGKKTYTGYIISKYAKRIS